MDLREYISYFRILFFFACFFFYFIHLFLQNEYMNFKIESKYLHRMCEYLMLVEHRSFRCDEHFLFCPARRSYVVDAVLQRNNIQSNDDAPCVCVWWEESSSNSKKVLSISRSVKGMAHPLRNGKNKMNVMYDGCIGIRSVILWIFFNQQPHVVLYPTDCKKRYEPRHKIRGNARFSKWQWDLVMIVDKKQSAASRGCWSKNYLVSIIKINHNLKTLNMIISNYIE